MGFINFIEKTNVKKRTFLVSMMNVTSPGRTPI